MKKKNGKKSVKKPYREQDFEMYILWKSLPTILREKPADYIIKLGFTDPIVIELLNIRNQTEFAEKFKIKELDTLTNWNKRDGLIERVREVRKDWARKLTGNVLTGLYKRAVSQGSAAEVKLWYQIVEEWKEDLKISPSGTIGLKFIDAEEYVKKKNEKSE